MFGARSAGTILAFTLLLKVGVAAAAEIRVLAPGGAATGVRALAAEFAKQTGTQVAVTSIPPSIVREKVLVGELFDAVVQATPAMSETERAGLLRNGSRTRLARGGLGVTVRTGGPVPDVSTVENFKRAMLTANKVVVGELAQADGAGPLILRVLEAAGILEAVRPKFQVENIVPGNELIARGGADIGLFNLTAIPYSVGVTLAGPVPPPLQVYTEYDGAVLAKAAEPDHALAFVRFMTSETGRKGWLGTGFETLPAR